MRFTTSKLYMKINHMRSIIQVNLMICNIIFLFTACIHVKTQPSFKGQWYVVQKGDTLSNISQRFAIPLKDIIEINHISDPSKITVSQKLFLPSFTRDKLMINENNANLVDSSTSDSLPSKTAPKLIKVKSDLAQQFRTL